MTNPLISICIPVYNGEAYLKECLDSCLAQTFDNYEIVVCDDGSTDKSVQIIGAYIQKGAAIRFFKNEVNLGLVGNWNRCLQLANGDWIKFLFQDDVMYANCLQVFFENIDKETRLLVCKRNFILPENAPAEKIDYYRNQVRTLENTGSYSSPSFSARTLSQIAGNNISLNFIGEPSLALFDKKTITSIGAFDADLKQICDLEFFLRLGSNYGLKYVPQILCGFRIHENSTTEKNITQKNYRLNYLETLYYAIKLLTKPGFSNFRKSLSPGQSLKLRWYVKYKSYVACTAIGSTDDKILFDTIKQQYGRLFFKQYERVILALIKKIQAKRNL